MGVDIASELLRDARDLVSRDRLESALALAIIVAAGRSRRLFGKGKASESALAEYFKAIQPRLFPGIGVIRVQLKSPKDVARFPERFVEFPTVLANFVRNPVLHEASLGVDFRIDRTCTGTWSLSEGVLSISPALVTALIEAIGAELADSQIPPTAKP